MKAIKMSKNRSPRNKPVLGYNPGLAPATTFPIDAGEVHVLIGSNVSNTSTLYKILAGSFFTDDSKILVYGQSR